MINIIIFFVLQLLNVILGTMRSVLTVKASKHVSAIFNAVSYTFYSGIVKLMTNQSMLIVLTATFVTNIIGVYVANFILEKCRKDRLWKIEATFVHTENFIRNLKTWAEVNKVSYSYIDIKNYYIVNFYAPTQKDTDIIRSFVYKFKGKYFISESKNF